MRTVNSQQQKICNIIGNIDQKQVTHKMIVDVGESATNIPYNEIREVVEKRFKARLEYAITSDMAIFDKDFKSVERKMNIFDIEFVSSTLIAEDICYAIADRLCDVMKNKPKKCYGPCINETEEH